MPCLNEAETLAGCIEKAQLGIQLSGVRGDILVADQVKRRISNSFKLIFNCLNQSHATGDAIFSVQRLWCTVHS